MRQTKRYHIGKDNSLWHIYRTVSFWKVMKNFIFIQIGRYMPFLKVKNWIYRVFLKMKIGETTAFALMAMPDVMFPENIKVGSNCIIGYNTTILTHEYLMTEYRIGQVIIGDNVMIGANTTVLPGVTIGEGSVVSAATLVNKDVPPGTFAGGNPMQFISSKEAKKDE